MIGVYEGENEDGEIEKEEYPVEYKYTDNNLVAIDGGGLKFGEQKNITNGVDPVICIYKFILTAITENSDFFPHLFRALRKLLCQSSYLFGCNLR